MCWRRMCWRPAAGSSSSVRSTMARPARRPGNLPAEATSFIGRRRELAEVKKKLPGARLVSLVGPGGVGKTRLAVRAATDLGRGFPAGAWLVELAEVRDPALVGNAVMAALDFAGADLAVGRAARRFAELGDPVGRAWLRGTTAFMRLLAGRLVEARRLAQVFLPFGEQVGEGWAVGTLRAVEAFAAAELGELAQADREARRAYRDFAAADDRWGRGLSLVVRGVIARGLAEPAHAVDLLTDALGYGESTGHPLLIGMAGTIRGLVRLDQGDPTEAEKDARKVLAVVEPHDVLEAAQVGPRVLLAMARLASGDTRSALASLAGVAARADQPSLLFPRRQAVACYAAALLAADRVDEAGTWARKAATMPGEDVRSGVVASRVLASALAAAGAIDEARAVAEAAVRQAYATQQVSERAAAEEIRNTLGTARRLA